MNKEILKERALNMIMNPTKAERAFRDRLDLKGIKYRTQVIMGRYIVDFLVGKTIYEIDGSSHDGKEVYDSIRDADLRMLGFEVVHIPNSEVLTHKITTYKVKKKKKDYHSQPKEEPYIPTPLEAIRLKKQQEQKNFKRKPQVGSGIKPKHKFFKRPST